MLHPLGVYVERGAAEKHVEYHDDYLMFQLSPELTPNAPPVVLQPSPESYLARRAAQRRAWAEQRAAEEAAEEAKQRDLEALVLRAREGLARFELSETEADRLTLMPEEALFCLAGVAETDVPAWPAVCKDEFWPAKRTAFRRRVTSSWLHLERAGLRDLASRVRYYFDGI